MKSESGHNERYKWILLGFIFVTYFLTQGTRQLYNAALPRIQADFAALGVTDTQLGSVGSVFAAVFGLSLVGSGLASDFFGRKRVLVIGVLLFSIGVCVSGFATGIGLMIIAYGVFNAIGQCCIAPSAYSLISQYHVRTRSVAMAVFQAAVYLGVVLASVFAGQLSAMGPGGWRRAFWLAGAAGVIWAAAMAIGIADDRKELGMAERPSMREAWAALIQKPTAMLIALAFAMFIYANLGIRLWTAMFMVRNFAGVGVARAALHSVLWLNLGALISSLAVARVIDRIAVRRVRVKLEVSVLGLGLCIAPIIIVATSASLRSCCAALFALGLTIGVYEAAHYPAMFDCIAPRYRSTITGLTGAFAFVFGAMAPMVLGWMSETFSLRVALASLGGFYLAGAVILLPAVRWYFARDYIAQA